MNKRVLIIFSLAISIGLHAQKVFREQNGFLVFEVEETVSPLGSWVKKTDVSGYTGNCHLEFTGNTVNGGSPNSPLSYQLKFTNPGTYGMLIRARKRLAGEPGDKCNDAWVRLEGDFTSANNTPLNILKNFTKMFGGDPNSWGWATTLDVNHVKYQPRYNIKIGDYTFTVAGRSIRFNIDRIIFYNTTMGKTAAMAKSAAATPFDGGCDVPGCYDKYTVNLTSPEIGTSVFSGETITINTLIGGTGYGLGKIEFYDNGTKLYEKNGSPYRHDIKLTQTGEHNINVVIYSAEGKAFYSDTVMVDVKDILQKTVRVEFEDYIDQKGMRKGGCSEGGYTLSTIDSSDWATYIIHIPEAGRYSFALRYASKDKVGKVNLMVKDTLMLQFPVEVTGGWQNWESTDPTDINLPAGEIEIKALFSGEKGNGYLYNVNYIEYYHTATVPNKKVHQETVRWNLIYGDGSLTIRDKNQKGKYHLKLYSLQGTLLCNQSFNGNGHLNIPSGTKGVVVVQLFSAQEAYTEKICIK